MLAKGETSPPGLRGEENNLFFLKRGVGGKFVSPTRRRQDSLKSTLIK